MIAEDGGLNTEDEDSKGVRVFTDLNDLNGFNLFNEHSVSTI